MILLGYYPDWVEAMPPAKVPYARYTPLTHAFALFQPNGTLKAPRHAAWEFPDTPGAPQKLVALAKSLRKRLPKALLTAAVPGGEWNGKHYDTKALLPRLDFVNIMAYDFAGPWSAEAGHNAPYSFCESAIAYGSARDWPAHKLLLGLESVMN